MKLDNMSRDEHRMVARMNAVIILTQVKNARIGQSHETAKKVMEHFDEAYGDTFMASEASYKFLRALNSSTEEDRKWWFQAAAEYVVWHCENDPVAPSQAEIYHALAFIEAGLGF